VRKGDVRVEPFFMGATSREFVGCVRDGQTDCDPDTASFWRTVLTRTLASFYLPLVVASGIVAAIVHGRV
jgi:hypothetical protein